MWSRGGATQSHASYTRVALTARWGNRHTGNPCTYLAPERPGRLQIATTLVRLHAGNGVVSFNEGIPGTGSDESRCIRCSTPPRPSRSRSHAALPGLLAEMALEPRGRRRGEVRRRPLLDAHRGRCTCSGRSAVCRGRRGFGRKHPKPPSPLGQENRARGPRERGATRATRTERVTPRPALFRLVSQARQHAPNVQRDKQRPWHEAMVSGRPFGPLISEARRSLVRGGLVLARGALAQDVQRSLDQTQHDADSTVVSHRCLGRRR